MNMTKSVADSACMQQPGQDASPDFSSLDRLDPAEEIVRRHVDHMQSTTYRSALLLNELGSAATQAEAVTLCMQYASFHLGHALQCSYFLQDFAVATAGQSASHANWY